MHWSEFIFHVLAGAGSLAYLAFLCAMLFHCYRSEPDWQFWFWVMMIAPGIGPLAYLVMRFLPSTEFPISVHFKQWTQKRQLQRLQIAAEQIGNPYQYILWGDALRDVKLFDRAGEAYAFALARDGRNLQALWGAAQVALIQKRFSDVRSLTDQILAQDPDYKFGDVLLARGRAAKELGDQDNAARDFEQHVRRWRQPESLYLLAEICEMRGDSGAAREYLTMLVNDVNSSPLAVARKYGRWKSQAQRMLNRLPAP